MLSAATAAVWSTYLHWLPCRESMLRGSIIHGYAYDYDEGRFSDACLRRMDGDHGPWESELNAVAMVLLGVAWLALVSGLGWQLRTKAVAAFPGVATLVVAGAVAIGDGIHESFPMMLLLSIELSAVVALIAISAWQPEIHGRHIRRLAVVLWGTTAFGVVHLIAEYMIMTRFSDANWDDPPGTGYLTVATIAISAILTAIMTLRSPQKGADDEPLPDHFSRPDDAAGLSRSPTAVRARVTIKPKQLIIGALLQVVSISLGVYLGYLAFLSAVSILDR